MSLSRCIWDQSILTARKHMDLANWLMMQQAQYISGSPMKMGRFLSAHRTCFELYGIPPLWYSYFCFVLKRVASWKVGYCQANLSNNCRYLSQY